MDELSMPTGLLVSAQVRNASLHGIPMMVLRRGDEDNGVIFLKVSTMDGFARIFSLVRHGSEKVWNCASGVNPVTEADADEYIAREASFDPDAWLVEVEDRQGRLWFPGRLLEG